MFYKQLQKGRRRREGSRFIEVGVDTLPPLPKDNTDRNRTSPFAFTGNKFEFRMVPSSASISGPSVVLNSIVAEALDEIATRLERTKDINKEATAIVRETMKEHGRVIFNGNNYSETWVKEADKRGLPHIRSTVGALETFVRQKSIKLFSKYKVLSKEEVHSRYEIYLEQYSKQVNIEAKASLDMAKTLYIPAVVHYTALLASSVRDLEAVSVSCTVHRDLLNRVNTLLEAMYVKVGHLEEELRKAHASTTTLKQAHAYRDKVFTAMNYLRGDVDALEMLVPRTLWPVPTYADLLFKL